MTHETSLRLPARLVAVRRGQGDESPPVANIPAPIAAPSVAVAESPAERQHLEAVIKGLAEAGQSLRLQSRQMLARVPEVAVELAIAVASRFMHQRLEAGDFPMENLVRGALEQLEARRPATIMLHPLDLILLEKRLGGGSGLLEQADVRFAADPSLQRGGCCASAGEVAIQCDMDGQLEALKEKLLETARRDAPREAGKALS
ncbi:MAG: hypothetical protein HY040_10470 [Planctomycetes bacterium]|nr:hypothetical protein [Planctomycetota bacterium]